MEQWFVLLTGIAIIGFSLMTAALIAGIMYVARINQSIWLSLRRQYADIDRDLQEMRDLLRG